MTDIIELVLHDHHAVAELFDTLQAATRADDQTALFAQVKDALERHASAEEGVVPTGPQRGARFLTAGPYRSQLVRRNPRRRTNLFRGGEVGTSLIVSALTSGRARSGGSAFSAEGWVRR